MIITGYHGTTKENANNVLKEKKFYLSKSPRDWLGEGIYFYFNYADALDWTIQKEYKEVAILHVIIRVPDENVIDFDSDKGSSIYSFFEQELAKLEVEFCNGSTQENQCALMNYIWEKEKDCKVMMASFARKPKLLKTMLDCRTKRKEMCVRSNEFIEEIIGLKVIKDGL